MTHSMTTEVSDEIYKWLFERAKREQKTIEQVVVEILEMSVQKMKTEGL